MKWLATVPDEAFGQKFILPKVDCGVEETSYETYNFIRRDVNLRAKNCIYQVDVKFHRAFEMPLCCDESMAFILLLNPGNKSVSENFDVVIDFDQKVNGHENTQKPILVLLTEWQDMTKYMQLLYPFSEKTEDDTWSLFHHEIVRKMHAVRDEDLYFLPLESGARVYFGIHPIGEDDQMIKTHAVRCIITLVQEVLLEHARQATCLQLREMANRQNEESRIERRRLMQEEDFDQGEFTAMNKKQPLVSQTQKNTKEKIKDTMKKFFVSSKTSSEEQLELKTLNTFGQEENSEESNKSESTTFTTEAPATDLRTEVSVVEQETSFEVTEATRQCEPVS